MLETEPTLFASSSLPSFVNTEADRASPVSRCDNRGKWEELIDYRLIEWAYDPRQLEDDGVEPPTPQAIYSAIAWARACRDDDAASPDTVVPDPNGGIIFERREGEAAQVLHVWEDGTVEYSAFQGTRLVARRTL
jgi:hypothetical protein